MNMPSNSGVKYGLILGIVLTFLSIVCYFVDPAYMFYLRDYFGYAIILYFMYRSILDKKRQNEGILSFKEAVKEGFVTYIIGTFFGVIFIYVMLNYFDPTLYEVMKDVVVQRVEILSGLFSSAEPDHINELSKELDQQDIKLSLPTLFFKYLQKLIFPGFIFAAILSAFLKKEA